MIARRPFEIAVQNFQPDGLLRPKHRFQPLQMPRVQHRMVKTLVFRGQSVEHLHDLAELYVADETHVVQRRFNQQVQLCGG